MMNMYKGSASVAIMEPLINLASLPSDLRLLADGNGGFSAAIRDGSATLIHVDPTVRMIYREAAGEIVSDLLLDIWGDANSGSYWWPFGLINYDRCFAADRSFIDLSGTIARAREFLERVHFVEDEDSVIAENQRAAAAVAYMQLKSRVTEDWIISLAAPHELRLDDDSIGEGDGLLLEFDTLPPGLEDIGETALVSYESSHAVRWWVRPAMCRFTAPPSCTPDVLRAARAQLPLLGFSEEDVRRLNAVAAEVARAYEWETGEAA
jgi:hypothetical protein